MTRNRPPHARLVLLCGIVGTALGCAPSGRAPGRHAPFPERKAHHAEHTEALLSEYDLTGARVDLEAFFSPGVPRDGIPALTDPERWNVQDASFPGDDGRVVEVVINGEAVAYPLAILAAHEIANDWVGGRPIAVAYCPLCDSVSVFDRRIPGAGSDSEPTTFGVSGALYQSNLTMYDHATMSLWSQVDMRALTGPHAGTTLDHLPLGVRRFADFRAEHPGGQVLSTLTGHDEEYEDEFYAAYFASDRLYMPVDHGDALPPKTLGMGVLAGNGAWFVTAGRARIHPVTIETPSGEVVIRADGAGTHAADLPPGVDVVQSFYFAWSALHPRTRLVTAPGETPPRESLLDGREKSFVIVGYSTSYAWPAMLQEMLDRHRGATGPGTRTYHVLNAVVGGAAVERWLETAEGSSYDRTMGAMLRDFFGDSAGLRGGAPEPSIALCQQSLQFTRTQHGPVASAGDAAGIEIGADALEQLALQLRAAGVERVYFGMHIYKEPVEPEVGNERLALAALLERGHDFIYAGPDVWQTTYETFPDSFDEDRVHPNELGMKIMAAGWYRAIAGRDARQDIIDELYATDYDVRAMMQAYIRWRRGE